MNYFLNTFVQKFFRLLETNNTNLGTQNKQNLLVFVQTHKNIIIYFLTIFFFVVYLGLVPVRKFILKYNSIFVCSVLFVCKLFNFLDPSKFRAKIDKLRLGQTHVMSIFNILTNNFHIL